MLVAILGVQTCNAKINCHKRQFIESRIYILDRESFKKFSPLEDGTMKKETVTGFHAPWTWDMKWRAEIVIIPFPARHLPTSLYV